MTYDDAHESFETEGNALLAAVEREVARVNVDMDFAASHFALALRKGERVSDNVGLSEILLGLDVTHLLHVLQRLPSAAGTEAFLDAMTASQSDFDAPPA